MHYFSSNVALPFSFLFCMYVCVCICFELILENTVQRVPILRNFVKNHPQFCVSPSKTMLWFICKVQAIQINYFKHWSLIYFYKQTIKLYKKLFRIEITLFTILNHTIILSIDSHRSLFRLLFSVISFVVWLFSFRTQYSVNGKMLLSQ